MIQKYRGVYLSSAVLVSFLIFGSVAAADEPEPTGTFIKCTWPPNRVSAVSCMSQCAEAGASCAAGLPHPYSSSRPGAGTGLLYGCKTGYPTWTCSYRYDNADTCTFVRPFGVALCNYGGRS